MNEIQERRVRRKAIRLTLQGLSPREILQQIPRSRSWLFKWQTRFDAGGWPALESQSRQPSRKPQKYVERLRQLVIRVRRALVKRKVGLIGAKQIQREIRQLQVTRRVPSAATIYRILHEAGWFKTPRPPRLADFPPPTATPNYPLQAMDWTCRYLDGGQKVFAFHTLDPTTRAMQQTISTDKTTLTASRHVLAAWSTLGVPAGWQLDNDAAFCGGYKVPRVFGQVVRLCLFAGVEPIFIPFGEPQRNALVERLNGLWSQAFWNRQRFRSVTHVRRASPQFATWYAHTYQPPTLQGQTPHQAQRQAPPWPLTPDRRRALPADLSQLPITAGRIHFIRLVNPDGCIRLLNESWKVGQRWAGQYVWATVLTHQQRLMIYHRRSAQSPVHLLKVFRYHLHEPVVPLLPQFKRPGRRRKLSTML